MKSPFIIKIIKFGIIGIAVFAIGHIVYTIADYKSMFTSFPLHTMIIFEIIFWMIILLVVTARYFLVLKFLKKIKEP